ncbi:D-inositol-3-phosphate glycosyltransferase [bioreactor metagenome]|uniref:D-inositol-3-phosphate glycosyltransferase n=1 Tax=bioreactor metagenome TaxID=1076179 RepID=A0A645BCG2_9ZZZZ
MSQLLQRDEIIILVGSIPKKISVPSNIIIIPPIKDPSVLAKFYSMADVFVNPSRQETFGLTTAEAISCGTPAVAYDVTACSEVVGKDREGGYVAKAYDVKDLYNKVLLVKSKGKLYFSRRGIERTKLLFDKAANISKYIEVYKSF